ncbi:hypothetical protein P4C99_18935 [Pontiellaceae bacterium B1224]|nr:hypothetical protein [Pontiellaceae bacterium B1224]
MNLPVELRKRVDEHINAVQQQTELPTAEQRKLLQALETHIHKSLEARSEEKPNLEALEAVIAKMDPPESYGSPPLIAPPNHPSLSSGRKILFISIIAILSLLFMAIWLADPFSSHWMEETSPPAQAIP